ncbi:MAG: sensor histidine kinase [Planctomycetota bacterium]
MTTASPPQDVPEPAGRLDHRLLFWLTQGVFFGIVALALVVLKSTVLDGLIGADLATRTILVRLAILVLDVGLLTIIYRQPAFRRITGTVPFAAATAAACLAVAAFDGALSLFVIRSFLPGSVPVLEQHPLLATVHRITLCVVWSVAHHALEQRRASRQAARRALEMELALRHSELERLGQQIEPHFLFNALSAVLACRHDPEAVEAVTTALADYLRFCLSRHGGPEPLAHELDAIELLLSVHEARFRGTLTCRVTSAPAARRVAVPPLLLSPLVDNALKYGAQTSPEPRTVAVEARVTGGQLVVEVTNSGTWIEPASDRPGTGLANLRRRLELSGLEHRLDIDSHAGVVTARVTLPAGPSPATQPAPPDRRPDRTIPSPLGPTDA